MPYPVSVEQYYESYRQLTADMRKQDEYMQENGLMPKSGAALPLIDVMRSHPENPWCQELVRRFDALTPFLKDRDFYEEYVVMTRS